MTEQPIPDEVRPSPMPGEDVIDVDGPDQDDVPQTPLIDLDDDPDDPATDSAQGV